MLRNYILWLLQFIFVSCTSSVTSTKSNIPKEIQGDRRLESYYTFIDTNMSGLFHLSENGDVKKDSGNVSEEIILKNIKLAYQSSKDLLDQRIISESVFKEFVLPYRLNDSPIHDWRSYIWNIQKRRKIDGINSIGTLIDSCNSINNTLKIGFKFDLKNTYEDTLTINKILDNKSGSCVTMANYAGYVFRALGIPVAIDFTPAWGNTPGGHVWNALITSDSSSIPFLGAEANIGGYEPFYLFKMGDDSIKSTYKLPGKIYRRTYSVQKGTSYYKFDNQRNFLPMTVNSRMIDVTDQYFKVSDIILPLNRIKGNPNLLYISNYNNGKFVPVMAVERSKSYIFSKMNRNLLYYVSTYQENKDNTNEFPLFLDESGHSIFLYANFARRISITLDRTQSPEADQMDVLKNGWEVEECTRIANGKINSPPIPGKEYKLYFWDKKWVLGDKKLVGPSGSLIFDNIPTGTMYLLCEKEPTEKERPFILYKDKIKWV